MIPDKPHWGKGIYEIIVTLFWALLIAVVFRTFLFQPFYIPSASMLPNLWVGDYVFVSKYSYGYSRFSFPLSIDWFSGRRAALGEPQRGDVVVFRLPRDEQVDYIKRIIGLPGDQIQILAGQVYINDEPIRLDRIEDFIIEDVFERRTSIPRYRESLDNGAAYEILKEIPLSRADSPRVYQVPEGHYFMMGDNRDNSTDSRYSNIIGYIPEENIIGRAEVIFFSVDTSFDVWRFWEWHEAIQWDRIWTPFDTSD